MGPGSWRGSFDQSGVSPITAASTSHGELPAKARTPVSSS